ncbi:MAG: LacI family DNA-binding transcriptional regulator [Paracoccaceae bacterium]|nr:LacI family DNA-binding transcriptional regulator [Paracoccaceae bacterium]
MRKSQKPTIYDIARLCGASPSTVSAALNGNWQNRRIREETVLRIKDVAAAQGYSINMQARGLRKARSGLVGMILPVHDNRFFSSLSQHFATEARARGLCPVIVSARREPEEEVRSVKSLLSYAIDSLFIAGATDPESLSTICRGAGLPHVFIDLPSAHSASVVSDNTAGADSLTRTILDTMPTLADPLRARPYLLGGDPRLYASSRRIAAFRAAVTQRLGRCDDDQVLACGYVPAKAAIEIERLLDRIGGLPAGLFINSMPAFEGALSYLAHLPPEAFAQSVIGCYDYDPFGAFLQFPVHMVRQNSKEMILRAFALLDEGVAGPVLEMVAPNLVLPRTIPPGMLSERG